LKVIKAIIINVHDFSREFHEGREEE